MTFLSKQCQPVFIYRFFMVNHKEIFQYGWIDMAYTICNFSHPIIDYSLLFNPLCFENQIKLIRFLSFLDVYYLTIKEICLKEMSIYTIPGDFLSLTLTIDFISFFIYSDSPLLDIVWNHSFLLNLNYKTIQLNHLFFNNAKHNL